MMKEYEIALRDLRFHARHGVWEQETAVGNEFIVTVSVRLPYTEAIAADQLEATISYADLFAIVKEEMARPRKLLEAVAASIEERITGRWPQIASGMVSICKSVPPISGIVGSAEVKLFF